MAKKDPTRVYVRELPDGQYKVLKRDEIKHSLKLGKYRERLQERIKKLQKEVDDIGKDCKHPVCYDEPGFMYDHRTCVVCGHVSLL